MSQKSNLDEYYRKTASIPPRPILVKAVPFVKERKTALDIGAGTLNDSKYLLDQGFLSVIAIDPASQFVHISALIIDERFSSIQTSAQEYDFPLDTFDLINAEYALPFITPETFLKVWDSIHDSLKIGGIFCGQLFGNNDDWHTNAKMTFCNKREAEDLFSRYEMIEMLEEEKDEAPTVGNMKHWHLFSFIIRKK